ncbi:hypothetical protein K470DRAFT_281884 [Piedraia hortae CBS 480.64]|uniref:Uncharacterized protein n=1 Tax=Piedraia hortae CBS 480.64 TaxID=1314780 RepID=A0A6A7C243_9PEZI|nr:hypothetical protein K470DRAFT_281884 [Piedraia hortae CBS 480.64]
MARSTARSRHTSLPAYLRLPLACVINVVIGIIFHSVSAGITGYELAAISQRPSDYQLGLLMAWKLTEGLLTYVLGYHGKSKDVAALTCLGHLPYYFFLYTFYEVDTKACGLSLAVDVGRLALPSLLMPPADRPRTSDGEDRNLTKNASDWLLTIIFGATIYALVIYISFSTWLLPYLVTHFDHMRSLEKAHNASITALTGLLLPLGWASSQYLFAPTVANIEPLDDLQDMAEFDPATASLQETLAHNLGIDKHGFSNRAKALTLRAVVLVAYSAINIFIRVFFTVRGAEPLGTLAWAGMWGAAGALTSLAYAWVGHRVGLNETGN